MAKLNLKKFIGIIAYPPGSIYITASNVNPADIWGGEWEKLSGTFLWAADSERPLGSVGGETTHRLTIAEMPSHTHTMAAYRRGYEWKSDGYWAPSGPSNTYAGQHVTNATGDGEVHNNMPPYTSVNMWKRLEIFPF